MTRIGDGGGEVDTQAFACSRAFDLDGERVTEQVSR